MSDEEINELYSLMFQKSSIEEQRRKNKLKKEIEAKSEILIDLEKKFLEEQIIVQNMVIPYLDKAQSALDEAIKISDELGAPFISHIGYMRPAAYIPYSFLRNNQKMLEIAEIKKYDIYRSVLGYGCSKDYKFWSESSTKC
jgi:hypothetical protein